MPSLLLICCLAPLQVEEAPPEVALSRTLARLVRQLDDDRIEQRQAAEQALIELGPDALPLLPPPSGRMSAEVKSRLARVRARLQIAFAERAVEATRVTLQGDMDLSAALAAMQTQTGNQIGGSEPFDRPLSVDLPGVPFWEALDRLLDQAQLTLYPFAGEGGWVVSAREDDQPSRCGAAFYSGLFRFEPTQVTAKANLRSPTTSGLRVRVEIAWEPRTTPILLSLPLHAVTAEDDLGRSLIVDRGRSVLNASVESSLPMVEIEIPLTLPQRDARRIARIEGTLQALIPGRIESFEFADLAQPTHPPQRRAGVTVTLERTRRNEDIYEVHLGVRFDDADKALESHRGWILKNPAYVVDAAGERIESGGERLLSQDEDGVRVAYLFALPQPLDQYRFTYQTPTLLVRQPIHYELKDIDLP